MPTETFPVVFEPLSWYSFGMIEADKMKPARTNIDVGGIVEIAKKHSLALVVLFGSRARGDARKKSDFDIAYSSIKPLPFHEENQMAVELHSVFKTIHVDIVNLSNAGPLLLKKIVDEGLPLYEAKESIFNNLYLYAMRIYRDSVVLNTLRRDYVLNKSDKFKKDVAFSR